MTEKEQNMTMAFFLFVILAIYAACTYAEGVLRGQYYNVYNVKVVYDCRYTEMTKRAEEVWVVMPWLQTCERKG